MDVDGAGVGAGKLRRLGHDRVEHGLEVERRVHRLGDLAHARLRPSGRAPGCAPALEQSDVLDRDHRLVGEDRGEIDLSVAESSYHPAHQNDHADRNSFAQQGNAEHGTGAHLSCGSACIRVILNISYMNDVAFKRSSPSDRASTRFELNLVIWSRMAGVSQWLAACS